MMKPHMINFISRSDDSYYLFRIVDVVFMVNDIVEIFIHVGFKHVKMIFYYL